ncbi:MAG TPA: 4-carboxymuconolactone decarboxylase [Mycobacteriales bacterium]|jgi:3-oxoadipate enol-lactonase/4-carboxymuconolactone decarboxylase
MLTGTRLGGRGPLLLVGPALGTSAATLWARCAAELAEHFEVIGWDLPGHGASAPATDPFTVADLAEGVLTLAGDRPFFCAGDSLGGAVALQLLLDHRVGGAALVCTGAKIGTPESWRERAALVRAEGTKAVVATAAQTWFGPGFADRDPAAAGALLDHLAGTDDASYAWACEALAAFDVVARLYEARSPLVAIGGAYDTRTPVDGLREIVDRVPDGRLTVLDPVGHLAPAEAPAATAALIVGYLLRRPLPGRTAVTLGELQGAGNAVRRQVLGDAHVDRAAARTTDLDRDFQDLIERFAWGSVWTRPGLDRRSRSIAVLTALVALGHHEELAMHLRAARTNGLTPAEIGEVLLQSAVYCGVPAANTAFRIARQVFEEDAQ